MKAKITQKRGRRTDSVSLDLEAISKLKHPNYDVNMGYHDKLFEISISIADINLTIIMDRPAMQTAGLLLTMISPKLIEVGKSMGGNVTDEEAAIIEAFTQYNNKAYKINESVGASVSQSPEECTPCQKKAQEGLADYFERIIHAYDNGGDVDDAIRDNIALIRKFREDLLSGGKVAKDAYEQAQEFLSKYP